MPEFNTYSDDAQLICNMLKDDWSLDKELLPTFSYMPTGFMTNAPQGLIYVYQMSHQNPGITTVDYRTRHRVSNLGIFIGNPVRERHFQLCEEVYRILDANRRIGQEGLEGYSYIEIKGDRQSQDLVAFYETTIDITLTSFVRPIRSSGFGESRNMNNMNCDDNGA